MVAPSENNTPSDSTLSKENPVSTAFDIVALAASAGGLKAIIRVLSTISADFPAAIAIVQHLSPLYPSFLAQILNRHTALQVTIKSPLP